MGGGREVTQDKGGGLLYEIRGEGQLPESRGVGRTVTQEQRRRVDSYQRAGKEERQLLKSRRGGRAVT